MKPIISTLLFLLSSIYLSATVYYVAPSGYGDGSSWNTATGDLVGVLGVAQPGDEIWVAAGTYLPTPDNDRNASFDIPEGVRLYGGFAGNEHFRDQRNWKQHLSILSGEIGDPGIQDNSFNVIYTRNVSAATVLDGFVITSGNANGKVGKGGRTRGGGGWHNDGSNGGHSTPSIRNCIFKLNHGNDGAAFYSNGQAGNSSPFFEECFFIQNQANLDGGAIYSNGTAKGKSHPRMVRCVFDENMASYGGGIFAETANGCCMIKLENCVFKENIAYLWGGGIYSRSQDGQLNLEITECKFADNYPTDINKTYYLTKSDD